MVKFLDKRRAERIRDRLIDEGVLRPGATLAEKGDAVYIDGIIDLPGTRTSMGTSFATQGTGMFVSGKARYPALPDTIADRQSVAFKMRQVQRDSPIDEDEMAVRVWTWDAEDRDDIPTKGMVLPHHDIMGNRIDGEGPGIDEAIALVSDTMQMFRKEYIPDLPTWAEDIEDF